MKQKSSPNLDGGDKLKIAVILPRFNDHIGKTLCENVASQLPKKPEIFRVPGAFEIPFLAQKIAKKFDVIIALGVIIKGETAHFDIIAQNSAKGIMDVSLKTKTPIINGILTCLTEKQARTRANEKGEEFAKSAIEMGLANL